MKLSLSLSLLLFRQARKMKNHEMLAQEHFRFFRDCNA